MAFRVGHDDDDAFVGIVVSLACPEAAQRLYLPPSHVDVVHLDVEVQTDLSALGFWNALERQAR